jgi:hypothetical protein
MVPLVWDSDGVGKVQEVYLASDYDTLLAQARRLREWIEEHGRHDRGCLWYEGMPDIDTPQTCTCELRDVLADTANFVNGGST